jgi:uncharacterized membrane protein YozB (DUF420 family)
MIAYLAGAGFIRPHSSIGADLSLVVMIAAAVMLTVGVVLAKSKRYEAHRWVQTAAVVLNAVPVVIWMIRSFWLYVRPGLPGNLSKSVDAITTVHAVAGLIGVAIGLFVMIRANQLMARGESLSRYKTLMRIAYVVYLLATALGVWVYFALYG